MNAISKLIEVLEHTTKSNQIVKLIKLAERESSVDITKQRSIGRPAMMAFVLLTGVYLTTGQLIPGVV